MAIYCKNMFSFFPLYGMELSIMVLSQFDKSLIQAEHMDGSPSHSHTHTHKQTKVLWVLRINKSHFKSLVPRYGDGKRERKEVSGIYLN